MTLKEAIKIASQERFEGESLTCFLLKRAKEAREENLGEGEKAMHAAALIVEAAVMKETSG